MIALVRLMLVARKRWSRMVFFNALVALGAMGISDGAIAGSVSGGLITNIYVNEQLGNVVYVAVSGTKSGNPSCSTNPVYQFVFSLSSPLATQMYSILLTARASQTPVAQLVGLGVCNVKNDAETLIVASY